MGIGRHSLAARSDFASLASHAQWCGPALPARFGLSAFSAHRPPRLWFCLLLSDHYVCYFDAAMRQAPRSAEDYLQARHVTVVYSDNERLQFDKPRVAVIGLRIAAAERAGGRKRGHGWRQVARRRPASQMAPAQMSKNTVSLSPCRTMSKL